MPNDSPESKFNPHPSDASRTEPTQLSSPTDSHGTGKPTSQLRIDSERESLELELFRVQREADAARHEAQAARCDAEAASIELKLRGMDGAHPEQTPTIAAPNTVVQSHASLQQTGFAPASNESPHSESPAEPDSGLAQNSSDVTWYAGPKLEKPSSEPLESKQVEKELPAAALASTSFQSWQEIREAFDHDAELPTVDVRQRADATENSTIDPTAPETTASEATTPETREANTSAPQLRVDSAHRQTSAPHFRDDVSSDEVNLDEVAGETSEEPAVSVATADSAATESVSALDAPLPLISTIQSGEKPFEKADIAELDSAVVTDDAVTSEDRRRKPAAWIVSTIVHAVILVVLGVVTLQTHKPSDQVALSASAPSASEVSMETFSLESSELETEPTEEQTESEIQYDLSPVGEIAVSDFNPPPPPSMPSPAVAMLSQSNNSAAAMLTKPSDSDAKIQFCGVDGGGNHFVYLVDSSKSMGDAFNSARIELLKSINALRPDQRFYVIFFDSDPDFMRLSDPKKDERRSAYATPQNKAALQRWAMSIRADRGRNPNDLLEFVLGLRADAIFLLSDGEFPQSTELLLKEKNVQHNLFDTGGLISRVHTIAYYSRAGESRMKRIAEQNQGQYRYIAKP
ncbi:hypothetical protein SH528x_000539 [Novipirellula sp. SH528]|uniref:hypothetical protein n=1 Tax=Novipirellula sp. SH528 TaxID=3454466 RepID=UPI003F9F0A9E